MEKKQEIEILQSLKGDTYFNQFFCSKDIDTMCDNIRKDFAIEMGCMFNNRYEALNKEKNEIIHNLNDTIEMIAKAAIDSCQGELEEDLYRVLVHEVGKLFIIKYKHSSGYALTDEEIDYLIAFMDKRIGDK